MSWIVGRVDVGHATAEHEIPGVDGADHDTSGRVDARGQQPAVGETFVAERIELVDGDHVGWEPDTAVSGGLVRPADGIRGVSDGRVVVRGEQRVALE